MATLGDLNLPMVALAPTPLSLCDCVLIHLLHWLESLVLLTVHLVDFPEHVLVEPKVVQ